MESNTLNPGSKPKAQEKTPNLDLFGKDITALAEQGKLDPIIGREEEIKRCCQILARKKKNNPILIGEAGVGKTGIAYGIAQRIVDRTCPRNLFNKRIILLDLTAVVAGTMYRGQFEERMKNIIDDVARAKNIILFIDEIHTIIGAGGASGSMDASNIIKPALADGLLQTIGSTTFKEFRENFEDDTAMTRRFQSVIIDPTSISDTIKILNGIKSQYEKHHSVEYTASAINACAILSERYITDRFLPDKAIDLLDEAGSSANINSLEVPSSIKDLETVLSDLVIQKKQVLSVQNYEAAVVIRDEYERILKQISDERLAWDERLKSNKTKIEVVDIENVVTQITGIPVSSLQDIDLSEMQRMEANIQKKVIGQDYPISKVVRAIKRSRVGMKNPNRPTSFMFIGSTGVGKTHLCKTIAKEEFGSEENFIRIDMSEYMERHNVSKLVGAPPGFIGYEKGGDLTEKVRRKPYAVVLLDEIEKAHPDVFNILLQILDDGHITDGLGRKIIFKHTIIIMTSNIGAKILQQFGTGVGFLTSAKFKQTKAEEEGVLRKALEDKFKPEFINRINEILMFEKITPESLLKIVDLELLSPISLAKEIGLDITVDDEAKKFLAKEGYDEALGVRPLARAIEKYISDPITDGIIEGRFFAGTKIMAVGQKDGISFI